MKKIHIPKYTKYIKSQDVIPQYKITAICKNKKVQGNIEIPHKLI